MIYYRSCLKRPRIYHWTTATVDLGYGTTAYDTPYGVSAMFYDEKACILSAIIGVTWYIIVGPITCACSIYV